MGQSRIWKDNGWELSKTDNKNIKPQIKNHYEPNKNKYKGNFSRYVTMKLLKIKYKEIILQVFQKKIPLKQ